MNDFKNDEPRMYHGNSVICIQVYNKFRSKMTNDAYLDAVRDAFIDEYDKIVKRINKEFKHSIAEQHEGGLSRAITSWVRPEKLSVKI